MILVASTLLLLILVLESRAQSMDTVRRVKCSRCLPWQLCLWTREAGQCEGCVSHLPCNGCQEAIEPRMCLRLVSAFSGCFYLL